MLSPVPTIKVIPFPDIPHAYVVISFIGTEDPERGNGVVKRMTFFVDHPDPAIMEGVEWEPEYGPITRIHGRAEVTGENPKHWFYPAYTGNSDWSQLGVRRSGLPGLLKRGNYKSMFAVLFDWIDRPSMLSLLKDICEGKVEDESRESSEDQQDISNLGNGL